MSSPISNLESQTSDRAILLTSPGAAALAVVRIMGPSIGKLLSAHFSKTLQPLRCVHGELRDAQGRVIDDPVVLLHEDQNAADINLHGGPWLVQSCLELVRAHGFDVIERSAPPLPIEALDGADGIESQALASLPLATTELALRVLLAQPAAWRQLLSGDPSLESLGQIAGDHALWWLLHPPRVAIVGAPNVGKSTLANQLFAQQRSITADLPGTTRDWVGEIANLDGLAVMLLDTPGLRETEDVIEQTAITRSREEVSRADLIIIVLDATRPLAEQYELLVAHPDALRTANKIDCRPLWDVERNSDLQTVATTGAGMDGLRRSIRQRFGCESIDVQRPRWWSPAQRDVIHHALEQRDPTLLRARARL